MEDGLWQVKGLIVGLWNWLLSYHDNVAHLHIVGYGFRLAVGFQRSRLHFSDDYEIDDYEGRPVVNL